MLLQYSARRIFVYFLGKIPIFHADRVRSLCFHKDNTRDYPPLTPTVRLPALIGSLIGSQQKSEIVWSE